MLTGMQSPAFRISNPEAITSNGERHTGRVVSVTPEHIAIAFDGPERARTVTLSPEEVADAIAEGVDAEHVRDVLQRGECFAMQDGRWAITTPLRAGREAGNLRGMPVAASMGEALARISAYWQARAAADALAAKVAEHLRAAMDVAEQHRAQVASLSTLLTDDGETRLSTEVRDLQDRGEQIAALAKFYREATDQ